MGPAPRLAFAPERTIQGQALRELEELPQVVGGLDGESARRGGRAVPAADPPASCRCPRSRRPSWSSSSNNCHTDLIYSFGNEVALIAERCGLDPLEVIRAANVDYPRPDLARPGYRRRRLPLQGSVHPDERGAARRATRPWLVGRRAALNERSARARGRAAGGHDPADPRLGRGRPAGRARLGVQGLAAHRRHARARPIAPMLPVFRAAGLDRARPRLSWHPT